MLLQLADREVTQVPCDDHRRARLNRDRGDMARLLDMAEAGVQGLVALQKEAVA